MSKLSGILMFICIVILGTIFLQELTTSTITVNEIRESMSTIVSSLGFIPLIILISVMTLLVTFIGLRNNNDFL